MTSRGSWTGWVCVLGGALVLSCGGPPSMGPIKPPPVEAVTSSGGVDDPPAAKPPLPTPYDLPTRSPRAKSLRTCVSTSAAIIARSTHKRKARNYDFSGLDVYPLPYGARIAEMGPPTFVRPLSLIRRMIRRRTPHINRCFRYARFGKRKPRALETDLSVQFTIGGVGNVSGLVVAPAEKQKSDKARLALAACVAQALRTMRFHQPSARVTKVSGTIELRHSGLGRPPRPAKRPAKVLFPPGTPVVHCADLPAKLPTDIVKADVLARFDDWDAAHERWERQRATKRSGAPMVPRVRISCSRAYPALHKADVRHGIRSNIGAIRACYIAALKQQPGLSGTVTTRFTIDGLGRPQNATASGVSKGLAACVANAIKVLWYPGVGAWTNVRLPLHFKQRTMPRLPEDSEKRAHALLERGDADAAAQAFAYLIQNSGGGVRECTGRLGVLKAMLLKAPWVLDERVMKATSGFASYAASVSTRPALAECLADAAEVIARVAHWPMSQRRRFAAWGQSYGLPEAVGRTQRLLATWPAITGSVALELFAGWGLHELGDYLAARDVYESVVRKKLTKGQARDAIHGYVLAERAASRSRRATRVNRCGNY